ncbi:hypothetical protein BU17DRAFT_79737 [Hysterangium stoloniferum]|nr:hypothetical protein BU17DRAFT_79737 [Hysterangium stoloniferum]
MAAMADTKSSPPPPGYPQQNYPNQQPQQTYFNGPGGQAGYANVQTQGQYVPQGSPYPPQGQHYPQQQPGQTHTVLVPVQQQPNVLVTQPQVVVMNGQCNPGQHSYRVHYGACGIIAAILLFPIGLLFLL